MQVEVIAWHAAHFSSLDRDHDYNHDHVHPCPNTNDSGGPGFVCGDLEPASHSGGAGDALSRLETKGERLGVGSLMPYPLRRNRAIEGSHP